MKTIFALWEWLQTTKEEFELDKWEDNIEDSDVSTSKGFRVYTEDWGHICDDSGMTINHYTKFALKPIYTWYGK